MLLLFLRSNIVKVGRVNCWKWSEKQQTDRPHPGPTGLKASSSQPTC